ncbi:10637_t:CDS:2 [Funneliformis geosporum]|uniref:10637_t:CDS:1 n=1 Tax=Funneliformis geosporum TaxID=1117311 RepID=A0A9W4SHG0_9GLOM|nr:10637_t:CDS:2 [Funneliformis geosporum]
MMYDILKTTSKTVEYLYDPNSRAEAMRIRYELLQQGKHVVFILTSYSMVQALAEKIFKLQRPDNSPDFSDINTAWDKLDYVAYTSYKNIRAELKSARPNNLPTAIRGHHECDKNIVSYKLDQSPAIKALNRSGRVR